jgi:hypothetical protein
MKTRSAVFFPFLALLVFVISVGCLCTGLTTDTPTEVPVVQPPVQQPTQAPVVEPTEVPATEVPVTNNTSGGLTTFTDQNNFYAIDVPADWTYEHSVSDDNIVYTDTFTSPDGGAVIENIVYNDGEPFTGSQHGKFALQILNKFYSKTGLEGDIRVSSDQIMKDGSERLIWTSKEGKYSGYSYFEIRDKVNFLMFTVNWGDAVKDQYFDTVMAVIDSYRVP